MSSRLEKLLELGGDAFLILATEPTLGALRFGSLDIGSVIFYVSDERLNRRRRERIRDSNQPR